MQLSDTFVTLPIPALSGQARAVLSPVMDVRMTRAAGKIARWRGMHYIAPRAQPTGMSR